MGANLPRISERPLAEAEALKQQEAKVLERQKPEAAASGSQSVAAVTRPRESPTDKAEHEKLNFDKGDEQPLHKIALMTAVAENLPLSIGKGLMKAEVRDDEKTVGTLIDSLGYKLLQKSPLLQGGLSRRIGERREDETEDDYLKRALKLNTPIINSAIAWTNVAQKKVRKYLRDEWNDKQSSYGSSGISFAQGKTQPGSATESMVTDMHGNPIELLDTPLDTPRGDETGEEPKPVVNTAFDADVWPLLSDSHQAPGARGSSRRRRRTRSSSRGRSRRRRKRGRSPSPPSSPGRIVAEAGEVRRRSVRRPPIDESQLGHQATEAG